MKLVKKAGKVTSVKISRSDWETIGRKSGWLKVAENGVWGGEDRGITIKILKKMQNVANILKNKLGNNMSTEDWMKMHTTMGPDLSALTKYEPLERHFGINFDTLAEPWNNAFNSVIAKNYDAAALQLQTVIDRINPILNQPNTVPVVQPSEAVKPAVNPATATPAL